MELQPVQKTNMVLYIITVILAFAILAFLALFLSFGAAFLGTISFVMIYIYLSIISSGIGIAIALILNKVAKSNKLFLLGNMIISFLSATVISITNIIINKLPEQLRQITAGGVETTGIAGGGMLDLFGEGAPNPFLSAVLIIIFFNILPLILFFRKEQKEMKDLLFYLYGFIGFLILYFAVPAIIF